MVDPSQYLQGDDFRFYVNKSHEINSPGRMVCMFCLSTLDKRDSGLCIYCETAEKDWDSYLFGKFQDIPQRLRLLIASLMVERQQYMDAYLKAIEEMKKAGLSVPEFAGLNGH